MDIKNLTWKEIKEALEKLGVKDTDEVSWIDISGDCNPQVKYYNPTCVYISNGGSRDSNDRD